MSEPGVISQNIGNPYKIVDHTRERRKGITASSLKELTNVARSRLSLPSDGDLTIVLEQDGKYLIQYMRLFFLWYNSKTRMVMRIEINQGPKWTTRNISPRWKEIQT